MAAEAWFCATCGVQHAATEKAPASCAIREDERRHVSGPT